MKFFALVPVLTAVAFGAMSVVAQGATAIVSGFDMVTELSDTARANADTISFTNSVKQFPVVVQNFRDIITTATKFTKTIQQTETLDEKGAKAVVVALTTFVEVHQALLNVVIGKRSIAAHLFFTAPVAAVLRSLEAAIDALAFALIDLIPTEKDHANAQFALLAVTLDDAEDAYRN